MSTPNWDNMAQEGQITNGDFFTVFLWHERVIETVTPSGSIKKTRFNDRSYIGDMLEVLSVDFPFVIAMNHNKRKSLSMSVTLDIRDIEIKKYSKEFVDIFFKHQS